MFCVKSANVSLLALTNKGFITIDFPFTFPAICKKNFEKGLKDRYYIDLTYQCSINIASQSFKVALFHSIHLKNQNDLHRFSIVDFFNRILSSALVHIYLSISKSMLQVCSYDLNLLRLRYTAYLPNHRAEVSTL